MQGQEVLFSSKSNEWETPQDLFDKLNNQYHFTIISLLILVALMKTPSVLNIILKKKMD